MSHNSGSRRASAVGRAVKTAPVLALGLVLLALGSISCAGAGQDAACGSLVRTHQQRVAAADGLLDELLEYREAVSLHDRTHHDLQFEYAAAVVEREKARLALADAGCDLEAG